MKDYLKYGIITLVVWNILLILMTILAASIRKVEYSYFFDDGIGGIGICAFLVLWSLIWFGIGYHSRKKYVQEKSFYKEKVPLVDEEQFNKEFIAYYISKHTKMLSIILATAIPWYIIGYVRGPFTIRDLIIILILALLSAISFWIYKQKKK